MDAQLGIEPSPFASEATVLETVCAAIHHWAICFIKVGGREGSRTLYLSACKADAIATLEPRAHLQDSFVYRTNVLPLH